MAGYPLNRDMRPTPYAIGVEYFLRKIVSRKRPYNCPLIRLGAQIIVLVATEEKYGRICIFMGDYRHRELVLSHDDPGSTTKIQFAYGWLNTLE
ncbi:hypothetical protein AJ80_09393 [Polytolypa hystricis UAMH7299]|uniref:Uncharacterized protein n=1 Tax=Polytolypa hystricis (strain UAMH7299) TaxID=1447883 RepID=A0A2B7WIT4_POLH7|nr:hypothetical protein AJ80_09393 [Polytolypa hystricis UAMH7299]